VSNDLTERWEGLVRWRLETTRGDVLASGEKSVLAAALADTVVEALDFSNQVTDDNKRRLVFVAELWKSDERLSISLSTFAPIKHLELTEPGLSTATSLKDGTLSFVISCKSLARFIELELDGVDVVFSDNYFDVPAGGTVTITAPLPEGWNLEKARKSLQVRSLIDSYR
jgi:beta-mannosidase